MSYKLKLPTFDITDKNTVGGLTLNLNINPYPHLAIGSAAMGSLEFNVLDIKGELPKINIDDNLEHYLLKDDPYIFENGSKLVFKNNDYYFFDEINNIIGIYKVANVEKINSTKYKVVCYDRMVLFNKIADSWFNNLTYPITIENLLESLCSFVGVDYLIKSAVNLSFLVENNAKIQNTNCRQILGYILEVMGCFGYFNPEGILVIDFYMDSDIVLDSEYITNATCGDFTVNPIEKLQIKSSKDDIGVIVGEGENTYIIENNPLLYSTTDLSLRSCGENLLLRLKNIAYTPCDITFNSSFNKDLLGKIIEVNTRKESYKTIVMEQQIKGINTQIKARGEKLRKEVTSVNSAITKLKGKSNEIVANIEKFKVTLTEVKSETEKNTAQLLIEADRITQEVANRIGDMAVLNSSISQQAEEIALKVSQTDYNGNTISSLINQTATTIKIQASRVNLNGYTTFSNLQDGVTTISGNNIKTGTISANRIDSKVLTTDNISAKNITISGVFKANGSYGNVTIENGVVKLQTSGWGNAGTIKYTNSGYYSSGVYFESDWNMYLLSDREIKLVSDSDTYITPKTGNDVFIGSGYHYDNVYIGSRTSTSYQNNLYAKGYYAQNKEGYTGSVSYTKSNGNSGTITITGGIITGVS